MQRKKEAEGKVEEPKDSFPTLDGVVVYDPAEEEVKAKELKEADGEPNPLIISGNLVVGEVINENIGDRSRYPGSTA